MSKSIRGAVYSAPTRQGGEVRVYKPDESGKLQLQDTIWTKPAKASKQTKLDIDKSDYQQYLKSDHWQELRRKKLTLSPACELCGTTENLNVHHLKYGNLYDIKPRQLMTLCRDDHFWVHDLLRARVILRRHKGSTLRRLILKKYELAKYAPESLPILPNSLKG